MTTVKGMTEENKNVPKPIEDSLLLQLIEKYVDRYYIKEEPLDHVSSVEEILEAPEKFKFIGDSRRINIFPDVIQPRGFQKEREMGGRE